MKPTTFLALGLSLYLACNGSKKNESIENDSSIEPDSNSVVQENQPITPIPKPVIEEPARDGQLIEEKGEIVFISADEYSLVSDPFDFPLSDSAIEGILGEGAKTKVKEFEGGEDFDAYTYSTTTYKDSEISYYSYTGKHSASIRTPLLPLKNGVKVGMIKSEFIKIMRYENANASKANVFRLEDDYGSMDFSFRADSLYHIHVFYEEGD